MLRMLCLLLVLCLPTLTVAQDRAQTLADIRQELSVLFVELQRLRTELNTTGGPSGIDASGGTLQRTDAIEAELRRLTSLTEDLQLRIDRVVRDGTNRVGDLEFRLCELETDCDIGSLGDAPSLGGETPQAVTGGSAVPSLGIDGRSGGSGPQLALSEQSDFDRARTAYDAGNYAQAAELLETFTQTYPGGPLSAEAHFMRGQSQAALQNWSRAARAYLDSFSVDPDAPRASESLLNLGTSLGHLGQTEEACLTLAEVEVRYPTSAMVANARSAMQNLNCN